MPPVETGTTIEPRFHAVEFYEDDEVLCDRVGRYVGAGLAAGEKVIVIATEPHRRSLALRLTNNAFDVELACTTGKLTFLDAREEAERIEGSLRFLSEASGVLAGSLDYEATLAAVARLAVPRIADWASIDMLNPDETFRRVAVAHVNPQKVELGWELSRRHPLGLHSWSCTGAP